MSFWTRLFLIVFYLFFALMLIGVVTLLFDLRLGALLLLAGVLGTSAARLAAIVIGYRQTMRRPWPKVRPLEDDDDDW